MSSLKKANMAIPSHMPTDNFAFCHSANEVDRKIITNFCKFQKVQDILDGTHPALCETKYSPLIIHKKDMVRKAWYGCRKTLMSVKAQNSQSEPPQKSQTGNWLKDYGKISKSRRSYNQQKQNNTNDRYKSLSDFAGKTSIFETESSDFGPSEVPDEMESPSKGNGRKQLEAYINALNQFMGKIKKEGQILSTEKEERQKK
jgi:hypothetical protein